ncbi:MAG: hypothetical protein OEL89_03850 [Candidatus Peregrinibacteria bacterium]|nr:hypothetical protein [Candidatus Peregrinibacteria bacterium]
MGKSFINKTQQKLSHLERSRRNPIPWIGLLLVSLAVGGIKLLPTFDTWETQLRTANELEVKITKLTKESELNKLKLNEIENEFKEKSDPYLNEEKQIFPETIDTGKITKIIELFALQLENLDSNNHDSYFSIEKLNFTKSKKEKDQDYFQMQANIDFLSDRENINEFIKFLQTGKLSERFEKGLEEKKVEVVAFKFLKSNLLPLIQIESIKISPQNSNDKIFDKYSGKFQIKLFSKNY